jgi:poly(A) polymerase
LSRLNADRALRSSVRTLVALHGRPAAYDPTWTDSAVRRLALDTGDSWEDLLDLAAADVTSAREQKRIAASHRVTGLRTRFRDLQEQMELARLESPLDGNDLMRIFDRPPGPWIKEVKNHLRELVIEGVLSPDDRDGASRIAREHLTQQDSSGGPTASRAESASVTSRP